MKKILTLLFAGLLMAAPVFLYADEVRYQYDENFPYGTFSNANFRAALRGLFQQDVIPLRPQAKLYLDQMEYGTTATATAQYSGTGVTITTDSGVFQEGSYSLKAVIDGTNNRTFARTYSVNLSAFTSLTVWTRASSTSSAIQFYLSDGTNSSYWDITTSGSANTWAQSTLTLASPSSTSGTAATLSAITSYGYRVLDNGVTYYFDTVKAIVGMNVVVRGTNIGSYYQHVYTGIQPLLINSSVSPTLTAPSGNPRIDILTVDSAGTLAFVTGTEAGSPSAPWASMPQNKIPIALVYCKTTMTKVLDYEDKDTDSNQGYIYADVRPFLNLSSAMSKGADVASASTTTLGNDGNVFDITGTTTITNITIKPAGTVIWLQFDGIVTVTDGGNLKLNGNFVTAAESTLQLFSDGTNWYEVSRQPTASTYLGLTDTPSSYSGQAYKLDRVNSGETGKEFVGLSSLAQYSVAEDGTTHKFQLTNDASSPGNNKAYGTNSAGTRGFYDVGCTTFTASGTYTASGTKVFLTGCGAGGGGAGSNSTSTMGGGGGGGECVVNLPYTVISGNNYTVTLNAGGPGGGAATAGTDGGTSVFDTITLSGGVKGAVAGTGGSGASANSLTGVIGSSGGAGGSFYSFAGGTGGNGALNGGVPTGGGGGGTIMGQGGNGGVSNANSTIDTETGTAGATNSGSGGGGGAWDSGSNANASGGNGATGMWVVCK